MSVSFLFLDECMSGRLDIAALTGVLVPAASYGAIRDELCGLVWRCLDAPPKTIPAPIELHGSALLRGMEGRDDATLDALRLEVFETVVRIVNAHRLSVYRVAYTNRSEIASLMESDPNLYGLTFAGIREWLAPVLEDTLVLPVMDGIPDTSAPGSRPPIDPQLIQSFSGNVRWIHHSRASGLAGANPRRGTHNLAEPTYSNSAHSVLIQLVDLVSYLLHKVEQAELEPMRELRPFRRSVLAIAQKFDLSLLTLWRDRMTILKLSKIEVRLTG